MKNLKWVFRRNLMMVVRKIGGLFVISLENIKEIEFKLVTFIVL